MLSSRIQAGPHRGAVTLAAMLAAVIALAGCTPAQYSHQADGAASTVLAQKQRQVLGQAQPLEIAYRPYIATSQPASGPASQPASGPAATQPASQPARTLLNGRPIPLGYSEVRVLSLDECLELAVHNSREYQTRKEELYLAALDLANQRHFWSFVGGNVSGEAGHARAADGSADWFGSGQAELTFAQRFATGATASLGVALSAATDWLGADSSSFGSLIEGNLTQPLLRGAWRDFAYEHLYRGERDVAIAVLTYQRYTQSFAADVIAEYYRVLQRRDQLNNELESLRRLEEIAKFNRAQVDLGMLSRVQSDQAEQNLLSAQARIETTRQEYQDSLDRFKLRLGLPMAAGVELAAAELEKLSVEPVAWQEADAIAIALRTRPDVLTSLAALRDAGRDVEIAADAFNPRLDLVLSASVPGTEPRRPFRTQFDRRTQNGRLEFDYALDQTNNRDAYKRALIAHDRARRQLDEFHDTVRLEVRQTYRALVQSRQTYEIQKTAVALAQRRTTLAEKEQKDGLASTRDVLEAQDALRASRNAVTAALVNYVTTRQKFLVSLGLTFADAQGRLYERDKPFYLDHVRPGRP